jgi:hypothetical protein
MHAAYRVGLAQRLGLSRSWRKAADFPVWVIARLWDEAVAAADRGCAKSPRPRGRWSDDH